MQSAAATLLDSSLSVTDSKKMPTSSTKTEIEAPSTEADEDIVTLSVFYEEHGNTYIDFKLATIEPLYNLRHRLAVHKDTFDINSYYFSDGKVQLDEQTLTKDLASDKVYLKYNLFNLNEVKIHILRLFNIVYPTAIHKEEIYGVGCGLSNLEKILDNSLFINEIFKENHHIPKLLNAICVSQKTPPNLIERLNGILMYIDIETKEGEKIEIKCTENGFISNNKENNRSVFKLISNISTIFKEEMKEIDTSITTIPDYPYINTPSIISPEKIEIKTNPLNTLHQLIKDTELAQNINRDWNNEFQLILELQTKEINEIIQKDQMLIKTYNDFLLNCVKAACLVRMDNLMPLNINDEKENWIYLQNNILLSCAYDLNETYFTNDEKREAQRKGAAIETKNIAYVINNRNMDPSKNIHILPSLTIDYIGKRMVAQSSIPGIFDNTNNNNNNLVVHGYNEENKVLIDNKEIEKEIENLMDSLHLKKHCVGKIQDNIKMETRMSSDTKIIKGQDSRNYIVDVLRLTPMDVLFMFNEYYNNKKEKKYCHKLVFLRPELIQIYVETLKQQNEQKENKNKSKDENNKNKNKEDIKFNVDAFWDRTKNIDEKITIKIDDMTTDEKEVYLASLFLQETVIAGLVYDIYFGNSTIPQNTESLAKFMHSRGINIRYLGKIITVLDKTTTNNNNIVENVYEKIEVAKNSLIKEMITRTAKHLLIKELHHIKNYSEIQQTISQFINNLLLSSNNKDKLELGKEIFIRFRYDTKNINLLDLITKNRNVILIELAKSIGFQLNIDLSQKDLKIQKENIVGIYPKIKHFELHSKNSKNLKDAALYYTKKETKIQLIKEAIIIEEQTNEKITPSLATSYSILVNNMNNDNEMMMVWEIRKKIADIFNCTLGIDHPDTILAYLDIAPLIKEDEKKIELYRTMLEIWALLYSEKDPVLLQHLSKYMNLLIKKNNKQSENKVKEIAQKILETTKCFNYNTLPHAEALQQNSKIMAEKQEFKKALNMERSAFKIINKIYGNEHEKTIESNKKVETYLKKALNEAKREKQ